MTTGAAAQGARSAPVLLVPDEPEVLATSRAIAQAAGRHVTTGWRLPPTPWDLAPHAVAVSGSLAGAAQEDDLVAAVVRGAGAIVGLPAAAPRPTRLIEALRRVGPVVDAHDWRVLRLDEVQLRLLVELARGTTTKNAARSVHLSVRTTHRRVAEARQVLGATSTNAAAAVISDALRFWAP